MDLPDLDATLEAARPARPSAATMEATLMLASSIRAEAGRPHGRRRPTWKRPRVVVFAVGLIGLGVLTGAGVYTGTHTGIYGELGNGLEGVSEYLGFQGEDFPDAVRRIAPDYVSYPGGVDPEDVTNEIIADAQAAGNGMAEESSVIANFEAYSYCSWAKTWVEQYDAGDADGAAKAAVRFKETIDYPATVAADAGGVIDHKLAVSAAADRGDRDTVQEEIDRNCSQSGRAGTP